MTFLIDGCPRWTAVLCLAVVRSKDYDVQIPWLVDPKVRKYSAQKELFSAGTAYGRTAQDPTWQPEICMREISYWSNAI